MRGAGSGGERNHTTLYCSDSWENEPNGSDITKLLYACLRNDTGLVALALTLATINQGTSVNFLRTSITFLMLYLIYGGWILAGQATRRASQPGKARRRFGFTSQR
jgi:hypothetical protein